MGVQGTDLERWIRERLFDAVPMSIAVIDRDFDIVSANRAFEEMFGDWQGQRCHVVYKCRDSLCPECAAAGAFEDGEPRISEEVGRTSDGRPTRYIKHTIPIRNESGEIPFLIEMSTDITEIGEMRRELAIAHAFLETLIAASIDGIIALDAEGQVRIFNRAARKLFRIDEAHLVTREEIVRMLPEGFLEQVASGPGHVYLPDSTVIAVDGEPVSARLIGVPLEAKGERLGLAFSVHDLTEIKKLERANIDAERLAAVGQTVAGLAHGVKNLIAGLEGGMYMLNTGIKLGDGERIVQGWDILDRNIGRISTFVKAFLSFSRGRKIAAAPTDPVSVAREVVELYALNAQKLGVGLCCEVSGEIPVAPLDSEGIHESLTNLVGNAIDACQMSDGEGGNHVTVRVFEEDDAIVFEVIDDGCGMDYEVKKKVFTNFFTSKGLGGTGIGLLQTRKIIQEHGGSIEVESEPNQGSTFRVTLPRSRLPESAEAD